MKERPLDTRENRSIDPATYTKTRVTLTAIHVGFTGVPVVTHAKVL